MGPEVDNIDRMVEEWTQERPDIDPIPMAVFARVRRLAAISDRELRNFLRDFDLTPAAFDVLANLRRAGAPYRLTPGQLAESSLLTTGAVTMRLDAAEELGLIERVPDTADRRVTFAQLTPKGLEVINGVFDAHLDNRRLLLQDFSRDDLLILERLLRRMEASLTTYRSDSGRTS